MQKRNESTFGDIKGVHIIADDIIIAAEDEKEHDAIMLALLSRARESGVRFNREKIQFKVNSVSYRGHFGIFKPYLRHGYKQFFRSLFWHGFIQRKI